ncbi:MAG TPA: class II fructose-bisphosphate aldolase [Candidatus Saccharimonadia bacterium]
MLHHIAAARALYARTRQEKFALGAFNVDNQETLKAVTLAAAAKQAPVLVEASHGEVEAIGLNNLRCLVDNYRSEYGVEMYINLDHSPSVEAAKAGIDAGFEFIHIDFSQWHHDATLAEIIDATKEVVAYAKKTTGALVESEPHYFGGGSNVFDQAMDYEVIRKTFTKPAEAKKFIEATGIDTYAVAIGNLHGLYPVPKQLDLGLLEKLRQEVPGYFSLHGGSGTPDDQFKGAVERGISKININSELRKAYRLTLEHELQTHKDEYAIVKLMPAVIAAVQAVVEHKIDDFGAAGKAAPSR